MTTGVMRRRLVWRARARTLWGMVRFVFWAILLSLLAWFLVGYVPMVTKAMKTISGYVTSSVWPSLWQREKKPPESALATTKKGEQKTTAQAPTNHGNFSPQLADLTTKYPALTEAMKKHPELEKLLEWFLNLAAGTSNSDRRSEPAPLDGKAIVEIAHGLHAAIHASPQQDQAALDDKMREVIRRVAGRPTLTQEEKYRIKDFYVRTFGIALNADVKRVAVAAN